MALRARYDHLVELAMARVQVAVATIVVTIVYIPFACPTASRSVLLYKN